MEIDTLILAGGKGSRLQPVMNNKPKCLALINGVPFIDILLDDCIRKGLRNFIVCVGMYSDQVVDYLSKRNDCNIVFSNEDEPLGTGGAIKNAKNLIKSDPFVVMNGDSYIDYNVQNLIKKQVVFLGSILLYQNSNSKSFGAVNINSEGIVIEFSEKSNQSETKLLNAGRYIFSKKIFDFFPTKNKFSLEYDILPIITKKKLMNSLISKNDSYDIGTPNRLKKAEDYFNELRN